MSADAKQPRVLSEWVFKWFLNLYPPLLFNRIRIVEVGPGIRYLRIRVGKSLLTRNLHGSIFGGTIYSAPHRREPLGRHRRKRVPDRSPPGVEPVRE